MGCQDILWGCVGRDAGLALFDGTRIWVVPAKQCALGATKRGRAAARSESQNGGKVSPFRLIASARTGFRRGCGSPAAVRPGPRRRTRLSDLAAGDRLRRASAGAVLCASDTQWWNMRTGANGHLVRMDSRGAITCLPGLQSWAGIGGGERCRVHPPKPGWRGRRDRAAMLASRQSRARRGRLSASASRSDSAGGGLGHSAAMIASNSARSRSSSAQSNSRNRSSAVRMGSPSHARVVGMTVTTVQPLMACRSSPLLVTEILRGLAFSATGIRNLRTPVS